MYEFVGFYHRKGVSSKTGKDYEFFQCYFLYPLPDNRSDCVGMEAVTINLNPQIFYQADLADCIGKKCRIRFSRYGRPESVEVV